MKERLISLAWAAPWMLFIGFPLAYAVRLPDPAQRAGLIGLCALLAVVNSATWLANPLPARNSFTRPFILSHAALAAATVAYLVYAVSVDTPHAFMMTSYLLVAWVFQAPGRFIVAGLVPVTAIAGVPLTRRVSPCGCAGTWCCCSSSWGWRAGAWSVRPASICAARTRSSAQRPRNVRA